MLAETTCLGMLVQVADTEGRKEETEKYYNQVLTSFGLISEGQEPSATCPPAVHSAAP